MDHRVVFLLILEGCFAIWLLCQSGLLSSWRALARCSLLIALALFIRLCFFDRENTDYQWFLKVWVDYYRANGGFAGLKSSIGNYNIPYLSFLALFSYSSIRDLYLIKLLSVFFDILLSFAALLLVKHCSESKATPLICFFTVLYLPTVLLNSSYWGQCDSIYVSLALLGLVFALPDGAGNGRPILSVICIAASFAFKMQAVFIMPVWLILWIWRKYKWYWLLFFPLTYLVLILPAVLAGRPFAEALLFYTGQTESIGTALNYNAPSLTAWFGRIPETDVRKVSNHLIILALLFTAAVATAGILFRKALNNCSLLHFACLFSLCIPFLLPHMHDRYFYPGEILTVILAFCAFHAIPSAPLTQFAAMICYVAYFTGYYQRLGKTNIFLTNDKGAVANLCAIIVIVFSLGTELFSSAKAARRGKDPL